MDDTHDKLTKEVKSQKINYKAKVVKSHGKYARRRTHKNAWITKGSKNG